MEAENYLCDELQSRCYYYRPRRASERLVPSLTYDAQGKPARTTYYWNNLEYNSL